MILSTSKNFIFIHIWKTAGTSVTKELLKYGSTTQRLAYDYYFTRKIVSLINRLLKLEGNGNKWFTGSHKHATAEEVKDFIGKERWDQYYSFVFVRNPYDWLVSWFFYVRQAQGRHEDCQSANEMTFKEFVFEKINDKCPRQWDFVSENNTRIVDYIGQLENLQADFNAVCEELELPEVQLGVSNQSNRENFLSYYDDSLMKVVEEYFEKDFIEFGYETLSK